MKLSGRFGLRYRMLPVIKLGFFAIGRSWNDYYKWMIDRQEQRTSIHDILRLNRGGPGLDGGLYDAKRGIYHVEFLKRYGLRPHHKVLDFGCGYGRTAIPLLKYLEPGNYIGVELSAQRARQAEEFVRHEKLEDRAPKFIVSGDNAMPYLQDASIDFIWAQSVATHMPLSEIRRTLAAAHRVLKPEGAFLFDYSASDDAVASQSNVKDFHYPPETIRENAEAHGFMLTELSDFGDDLAPGSRLESSRMNKLTIAS